MATFTLRDRKDGQICMVRIRKRGFRAVTNSFPVVRKGVVPAQAKTWAKDVEADMLVGKFVEREKAGLHTLKELIAEYTEDEFTGMKSKIPNPTGQRARVAHLDFWLRALGNVTLDKIDPGKVSEVKRDLLQTRAPATVNRYLAALSATLRYGVTELLWMTRNPIGAGAITRVKEDNQAEHYLTADEERRLLLACDNSPDPRLYPLVVAASATGARRSELVGLKWSDVNFETTEDRPWPEAKLGLTKNGRPHRIVFPGESERVIRKLYSRWLASQKVVSIDRADGPDGYVFASQLRKNDKTPSFPKKSWTQAIAAAGLKIRFHDLRHTFAKHLIENGASLAEVAACLNHKTLAATQRYANISQAHQHKVAARTVEAFLG